MALRLLHGSSLAAVSSIGGAASGQAGQAQATRRIAKSSRSEREYVLMILSPLYGFLKLENKRNSGAARGVGRTFAAKPFRLMRHQQECADE
jgi:hypothetical protein